jgi:hypothetical protein
VEPAVFIFSAECIRFLKNVVSARKTTVLITKITFKLLIYNFVFLSSKSIFIQAGQLGHTYRIL